MSDESNVTEVTEVSERKSKGLLGYSEEAKIVNNISSRSTLQVTQQVQSSSNTGDRLSSEALFDTDEDNGGITMSAGIISVICVGIIGSLSAFSIMFVYVYRRRFLNNPQTLSEPDSSGYIDESSIRVRESLSIIFDSDLTPCHIFRTTPTSSTVSTTTRSWTPSKQWRYRTTGLTVWSTQSCEGWKMLKL